MARITNKEIIEKLDYIESHLPNGEIDKLSRRIKDLKSCQDKNAKTQEKQFEETNKHIRSLEKRLYNPDDGIIVRVNSLNIFKSSITKAL